MIGKLIDWWKGVCRSEQFLITTIGVMTFLVLVNFGVAMFLLGLLHSGN